MWQYRVITLPACRISTYQPQPCTADEPSMSQLHGPPFGDFALHLAVMTTPADAACTTVPLGTARSTPLWLGRSAVRKPETISARTGTVQPDAEISPGFT